MMIIIRATAVVLIYLRGIIAFSFMYEVYG